MLPYPRGVLRAFSWDKLTELETRHVSHELSKTIGQDYFIHCRKYLGAIANKMDQNTRLSTDQAHFTIIGAIFIIRT